MINRRRFIKSTAAVAAGALLTKDAIKAAVFSNRSHIDKVGLQLFSVPKMLDKDFEGTMKTLSEIGYKELEFFGPYPFSTESAKKSWAAVTPSLGFSGSGYFGHTTQ